MTPLAEILVPLAHGERRDLPATMRMKRETLRGQLSRQTWQYAGVKGSRGSVRRAYIAAKRGVDATRFQSNEWRVAGRPAPVRSNGIPTYTGSTPVGHIKP